MSTPINKGDMIVTHSYGLLAVTDVAEFDSPLLIATPDFDMDDYDPDGKLIAINPDIEVLTVNGAEY